MKTPSISLIVIRATDIQAALVFYRVLGLSFVQEQHGSGPVHYSSLLDGMVFEIYPSRLNENLESINKHSMMIGVKVDSLEQTLSQLKSIGVELKEIPKSSEWGRWVNVTDPDGRTIQINEVNP